jgi:hypothetical protein
LHCVQFQHRGGKKSGLQQQTMQNAATPLLRLAMVTARPTPPPLEQRKGEGHLRRRLRAARRAPAARRMTRAVHRRGCALARPAASRALAPPAADAPSRAPAVRRPGPRAPPPSRARTAASVPQPPWSRGGATGEHGHGRARLRAAARSPAVSAPPQARSLSSRAAPEQGRPTRGRRHRSSPAPLRPAARAATASLPAGAATAPRGVDELVELGESGPPPTRRAITGHRRLGRSASPAGRGGGRRAEVKQGAAGRARVRPRARPPPRPALVGPRPRRSPTAALALARGRAGAARPPPRRNA